MESVGERSPRRRLHKFKWRQQSGRRTCAVVENSQSDGAWERRNIGIDKAHVGTISCSDNFK